MIIVELHGGLGNQMFQYALGKSLAEKNKTKLKLDLIRFGITEYPKSSDTLSTSDPLGQSRDRQSSLAANLRSLVYPALKVGSKVKRKYYSLISTSYYHSDIKRKYELNHLNISGQPLSHSDRVMFRFKKYTVKTEPSTRFDPTVLDLGDNSYLLGFWQSEQYFKHIRSTLLSEFKVVTDIGDDNREILKKIQETNSVFVHVRRGDYVSETAVTELFAICNKEYFDKAIKIIKEKIENPSFFIFSDDPDWAKENIDTGDSPKYVSYNLGSEAYKDLALMYNCKHGVISNSSFSWWGAWLQENKDKIVIAPKVWFKDKALSSEDVVPESWISI